MTQDELKELIHYNSETGEFRWTKPRKKIRVGWLAGRMQDNGYRQICIKQKQYYAHRLAWFYMTGEWPKDQIDHINRVRDDNRWCNLREATCAQNLANSKPRNEFKGVRQRGKRFEAFISIDKKYKYLGMHDTVEEAHLAYMNEAEKHWGNYTNGTNSS